MALDYAPNANFRAVVSFLKGGKLTLGLRTGDDARYAEFLSKFPADRIGSLTEAEYCIGDGQNASFSWWIERGLEVALGRYMPGSARGHLMFRRDDGTLYKHRRLLSLSDSDALEYTLKVQQAIAVGALNGDPSWIDSDAAIYAAAQVTKRVTVSDGRKLRLISIYRPDDFLPISSAAYLRYFLGQFGIPPSAVPPKSKPIATSLLLFDIYTAAKQHVPALTPHDFMCALYEPSLGLTPPKEVEAEAVAEESEPETSIEMEATTNTLRPLNTILYGPPGTGKTYQTIEESLSILDPEFLARYAESDAISSEDRHARRRQLKRRFDELSALERIRFVTFHQSFSYEDFVEGLRADADGKGALRFRVEDGVFKSLCQAAASRVTRADPTPVDPAGRRVWKMSLGNTLGDQQHIYDECIAGGYALLGYGDSLDFAGCTTRAQVESVFTAAGWMPPASDYGVGAVVMFLRMKVGDLVVVTEGNFKVRAIGEVVGDYEHAPRDDDTEGFRQKRKVRWLRTYSPSLPHLALMNVQFSQQTLYELRTPAIDMSKLRTLLNSQTGITARSLFSEGDTFNKGYKVLKVLEDVLFVQKPNESKVTFPWELLMELATLMRSGRISLADISQGNVFENVKDCKLEKNTVNGYANILAPIVARIEAALRNSSSSSGKPEPAMDHVLIIDEINRGNVSRIFGELITLIEPSKRAGAEEALLVTLPYSKKPFSVPNNVHLIGTMNSADRSLTGIDVALRRRFHFKELPPRPELLDGVEIAGINVGKLLRALNGRIEVLSGRDFCLGHAYFLPLRDKVEPSIEDLGLIFRSQIIPLLQEYFFDDWERIGWVLNDHQAATGNVRFLSPAALSPQKLFGVDVGGTIHDSRWHINEVAFVSVECYVNALRVG